MVVSILLGILLLSSILMMFCFYMLIRNSITLKHSVYWVEKVYEHQIDCIGTHDLPSVDYSDIMEYNEYLWKLLVFDRDKMIKDNRLLEILKQYEQDVQV